jgi:hypothetical protein
MHRAITPLLYLLFRLAACFVILPTVSSSASPRLKRLITCPFSENGHVSFHAPNKLGDLPKDIDFEYPAKATRFSFRDGNLSLVAMDESEPTRVRIVVSAQLNKKSRAYDGQIFVDVGGNELMLDNGPVHCTISSK